MCNSLGSGRRRTSESGYEDRRGIFRESAHRRLKAASGFTLVELLLAAGAAVLVVCAATLMFLDCAKEDRRVFGDASVQEGRTCSRPSCWPCCG